MTPIWHNNNPSFLMTLTVGLIVLASVALACGPAAPGPEQPKPICDAERWNPEVHNCIKPTEPPPNTPVPTPTTPVESAPARAPEGIPATPVPPLLDQIKAAVQSNDYDAIAQVKVVSHSRVTITPTEKNFIAQWTRSRLEVTQTLRGNLPATLDIVTPTGSPNGTLDIDGNYILFLVKGFVDAEDSQYADDPTRIRLNQRELIEFGGQAFDYLGRQVWAVDGTSGHRVPVEHIVSYEVSTMTDLEVARDNGERMALEALEQMLRPPDN